MVISDTCLTDRVYARPLTCCSGGKHSLLIGRRLIGEMKGVEGQMSSSSCATDLLGFEEVDIGNTISN